MNELALFAGAGGGILGGLLIGCRTICAVERDAYAAQVLAQRQNDRTIKPFPIWSDVKSFDGHRWRGRVDLISGGFPCQDISLARSNNKVNGVIAGLSGEKSSLWSEYKRVVGEVLPQFVFIENSPNLRGKGLDIILKDLDALGYNAAWCVLGAGDNKAPHQRKRLWIMATNTDCTQQQGRRLPCGRHEEDIDTWLGAWWKTEPNVYRVDDGVANRMDRLIAIGNGQVPTVAARAFVILQAMLGVPYEEEEKENHAEGL